MLWKEEYAIGSPEVDRQHQELFRRLEQLIAAVQEEQTPDALNETLMFLSDYVNTHFADEEQLMEQSGYPGLAGHHAQHEGFKEELALLIQEVDEAEGAGLSKLGMANNLIGQISEWLIDHILDMDQELGDFLRTNTTESSDTTSH